MWGEVEVWGEGVRFEGGMWDAAGWEGGGIMVCAICIHRLDLLPIYNSRVFLVYIC